MTKCLRFIKTAIAAMGLFIICRSSTSYASLNCDTAVNITVPVSECKSLIAFYTGMDGANWNVNNLWDTDTNICTWPGITCESIQEPGQFFPVTHVTKVGPTSNGGSLFGNRLFGEITGTTLVGIPYMKELDLSYNGLVGDLPSSRSGWRSNMSRFNLSHNKMSGPLPSSWSAWDNIYSFDVSYNKIRGQLPSSWSTRRNPMGGRGIGIHDFRISYNSLTGTSIPSSWSTWSTIITFIADHAGLEGNLPSSLSTWGSLEHFDLSYNSFTGVLPSSWSGMTSMYEFYFQHNNLTGTLPDSWSTRTDITQFLGDHNNIQGPLPTAWSTWTNMRKFVMSYNNLTGTLPDVWNARTQTQFFVVGNNNITGPLRPSWSTMTGMYWFQTNNNSMDDIIPHEYTGWSSMIVFDISANSITGSLFTGFSSWGNAIQYFKVSYNNINGTLPDERSNRTEVDSFLVDNNDIEGVLPHGRTGWSSIAEFQAQSNNLTGDLPDVWSSLSTMEAFNVSNNQISGSIPSSWSSWLGLTYFNTSYNQLTDILPSSFGLWTGMEIFDVSDNQLTGSLPLSYSGFTNIETFDISNNTDFYGPIPTERSTSRSSGSIDARYNCLQTTGYPTPMQTWLSGHASMSPQDLCFTLQYTSFGPGTLSGTTTQTVAYGGSGTAVLAIPDTGYAFSYRTLYDLSSSTVNPTIDTNVTGDRLVMEAYFVTGNNVIYLAGTGGIISGQAYQIVLSGDDASTVTAVPNAGYTFSIWSDGYTGDTRTDLNVTGSILVTALFTIDIHTLTYATGAGGQISGSTPQSVSYGGTGTAVTASPDLGYAFSIWSDGYTGDTRTDGPITGDTIYTGYFVTGNNVTYLAGTGGSISGQAYQIVLSGDDASTVTAIPNTGYTFSVWSDGFTVVPTRTDLNIISPLLVTALFTPNDYTLTYVSNDGTGGSINGLITVTQTVAYGDTGALVTASPSVGYYFSGWSDGYVGLSRIDGPVTGDVTYTGYFLPNSYTLTYSAGSGGSISGQTSQSVAYGSSGTAVEPIPDPGYMFIGWDDGSSDDPRVDDPVLGSINVTALFGPAIYTLRYDIGIGGTLSGTSPQYVSYLGTGTSVTVVADTGYSFVEWIEDGYTGDTRIDGSITGNTTFTALFVPDDIFITYLTGVGGQISGSDSQIVPYGGSGTSVTAVADSGYIFVEWMQDGYTGDTRAEINVTSDKIFTALFMSTNFTLTYATGAGGTISGSTPQTVASGSNGTAVTAVADTGYIFSGWSDGYTGDTRTDGPITGNTIYTGYFILSGGSSFTLTYATGAGGTISGSTPQTVASGSNGTTVTAVADTGYVFSGWSDGYTGATRTDGPITGDVTYTGYFMVITPELTYIAGTGGMISGSTSQSIVYGGTGTTVYPLADSGYTFIGWSDGSTANPRTDTNVTGNITVTALFIGSGGTDFILSYTGSTGGIVTGSLLQVVASGGNGTSVTAVAAPGYAFSGWDNGSTANPRTDTNVTGNITGIALFTSLSGTTYIITYATGVGGQISGSTPQIVVYGSSGTTVTAVPDTGYSFVEWIEDGYTGATRFESNVTGNMTLTALFTGSTYTLQYTPNVGGTITGSTLQLLIPYGGSGTQVTALPDPGYNFIGWSDGYTGAIRIDINVTNDVNVDALFMTNSGGSSFILNYTGSTGGIVTGSLLQVVASGGNGTSVTAVASSGYVFVAWDNGSTANPRTDTNVTGNITGIALFTALSGGSSFTLTYLTGAGGQISGTSVQTVASGGNGTAVYPLADSGYTFVGWSDSSMADPRTDTNVTGNITVTALFIGSGGTDFILSYTGSTGGIVTGSLLQVVSSGGNGTSVTAVASSGYVFVAWDNGSTANPRTDTNVTGNITGIALFTGATIITTGGGGSSGGGGGGGGGMLVDNCPNGDFSPSYYDNTCLGSGGGTGSLNPGGSGTVYVSGSTNTGNNPVFNHDFVCKYTDGNFVAYKNTFTDMGIYTNAISLGLNYCIYHGQVRGKEFRPYAYTTYGASYKIFARLAGLDVKESTKNLGNNRSNVYKIAGRKAGLFKGVTFPSNPDTLIDSRTFAKMVQNLFTYYGRSDLSASDFVKGTSNLQRGRMTKIVANIIDVIE